MKKFLSVFLSLVLAAGTFCVNVSAEGNSGRTPLPDTPNSWRYKDGQPIEDPYALTVVTDPYHPDATLTGIDVSVHNGEIDWEKVKADGIGFAIIRCGYGSDLEEQDDKKFIYNATECERLGIPYGVYLYGYSVNAQQAETEADHALRLLEGLNPTYPVYYDMEDYYMEYNVDTEVEGAEPVEETLKEKQQRLASIASAFCTKIANAGYTTGVYACLSWWQYYLTDPCFDNWNKWVAQWNNECEYDGEYAIWQYYNKGVVDGINGDVDMNFLIGYPKDHNPGVDSTDVFRISGKTRYETSYKIANEMKTLLGVEKFDTVIVASGTNFADALAGSYLAYLKSAPILITTPSYFETTKEYISANLAEGGTVYILGGTGAVPAEMETGLEAFTVKRLYGKTRFETNIEILKESGVTTEDIIVCTGHSFADSLSASAAKKPILLVDNKSTQLSTVQTAYLETLETEKMYIIGGTGAVNEELATTLTIYGTVERIGGKTRYNTSVLVAEKLVGTSEQAVLAYGQNFPDGLCGGPLAAMLNAPLILTANGNEAAAEAFCTTAKTEKGYILGGTSVVTDDTVKTILKVWPNENITVK